MRSTIKYIQGINGSRLEVNGVTYTYGYNCSRNRKFARFAEQDHEDAIKYNWKGSYPLKPFIGDILEEVCPDWRTARWTGVNIFAGRPLRLEEIRKIKKEIEEELKNV